MNLAKIGDVRVRWSRPPPSVPSSVTVIKGGAGRFCASFVVEAEPEPLAPALDADLTASVVNAREGGGLDP